MKHYFAVGSKVMIDMLLEEKVQSILMSYAYAKKGLPQNLVEASRGEDGIDVMVDSGGFTNSFKPGSVVLEGYCDFLKSHLDAIDEYVVLDSPQEREVTMSNYEHMLEAGLDPMIVDHMWFDLQEPLYRDLYQKGVKVCWGGMSSGKSVAQGNWIPEGSTVWGHISSRIDERHKHAIAPPLSKVHLLAVGQRLRKFLPYFDAVDSFDAATWMRGPGEFGSYPLYVPPSPEQPYPKYRQLFADRAIPDLFWQKAEAYGLDPTNYTDRIRMTIRELKLYFDAMEQFYEENKDNGAEFLREVSLKKSDDSEPLVCAPKPHFVPGGVVSTKAVPSAAEYENLPDQGTDQLAQWHWDLHMAFRAGSVGGSARDQLITQHAGIVDEMYGRGIEHPPPPDDGLDEASAAQEDYASSQPKYWEPIVEPSDEPMNTAQLQARRASRKAKKDLGALTDLALVELRKFVLPSVSDALISFQATQKDAWTGSYVSDLPDSAFLYVEPGGKKDAGSKTAPRSLRHFPYKDASGKVDLAHLRNALARIPQSNIPSTVKDRISAEARRTLEAQTKATRKTAATYETRISFPILKIDNEERLMTGVVLEPDEVDAQNDTVQEPIIKAAAHRFLANYGRADGSRLGLMHKKFGDVGLELVESWIAPMDLDFGKEKVKKGSWLMTVKAVSDQLWNDVKTGRLTGFSIGGVAALS